MPKRKRTRATVARMIQNFTIPAKRVTRIPVDVYTHTQKLKAEKRLHKKRRKPLPEQISKAHNRAKQ
jgi:hypothetical protein